MYSFCTYFDRHYLSRGLALYHSLRTHCSDFRLWVLCMDDDTYDALIQLGIPEVEPIALQDFEKGDAPLLAAKEDRSRVEYYFTCTPSLPLYILHHWSAVDLITYLDADLFFFASPAPLFEELGERSIAIIRHRFASHLRDRERYGIFNVGWLSFRRDESALHCLHWWRERCMDWCYDRAEDGRFADQKYLDDWPSRFPNVVILEHKGANLALWNLANYHLRAVGGDSVMVDAQSLIFFHFHGLRRIRQWLYDPGWIEYGVNPSTVLRRRIYGPYLQTLFHVSRQLLATFGGSALPGDVRPVRKRPGSRLGPVQRTIKRIRSLPSIGMDILTGRYVFVIGGYSI